MAREDGIYRRGDSRYWWFSVVLPNGKRLRQSTGTENREEAQALLAKLKLESFREYLEVKAALRSIRDVKRICRNLDPYLGDKMLTEITGDVVWSVCQREIAKGNKPATVNRYLAVVRGVLRTARDEWQWIDNFPKIRLLPGEVERDRWLTREEADKLIAACAPHLAAIVRFALATGCRASEITGLEWSRVDLERRTAWLNHTKNGTPRGVPLNEDAVAVLEGEKGKHSRCCFTYRGEPIRWGVCNTGWLEAVKKAELADFRFHWVAGSRE